MKQEEIKKIVFKKTFGCCAYCGERLSFDGDWEIDHIVPKSRGGKDVITNYFASCKQCNNRKRDNDPEEYKIAINSVIYREFSNAFSSKRIKYPVDNYINTDFDSMMETVIAFEKFVDENYGVEKIKFYYEVIEDVRISLAEKQHGKSQNN